MAWIAHVCARNGLLAGGKLECTSSTFASELEARDWVYAMSVGSDSEEGHVYGPGVRVELAPSCDLWMRGARYGEVMAVNDHGIVMIRMDHKSVRKLQRLHASRLQRAL